MLPTPSEQTSDAKTVLDGQDTQSLSRIIDQLCVALLNIDLVLDETAFDTQRNRLEATQAALERAAILIRKHFGVSSL